MNKAIYLSMLLFGGFFTQSVVADDELPKIFLGAKGGYQTALDDSYEYSAPKGAILGVYSGLILSPQWSWDVGYQYHNKLNADATLVSDKTWFIESGLRYDWYFKNNISLYGRLGFSYWNLEKGVSFTDSMSATGYSPLIELGMNHNVTSHLRLSVGYQYIDSIGKSYTGKYDSSSALVSISYVFPSIAQRSKTVSDESTLNAENDTYIPVEKAIDQQSEAQQKHKKAEAQQKHKKAEAQQKHKKAEAQQRHKKAEAQQKHKDVETQTRHFSQKKEVEYYFGTDSTDISDDFVKSLMEVAAVLNEYHQAKAVIVGHADSMDSPEYNQNLSEMRAQAVAEQLISLGVDQQQLVWSGVGASQAINDIKYLARQTENYRKVEVIIPSFHYY